MEKLNKLLEIKKILGKPYFEIPGLCLLYKQDSLEALKKIKEGTFNAVITSPPYNIGKEYEQIMQIEDYVDWTSKWIDLIYKASANNSNFLLNVGFLETNKWKCVPIPYLIWDKTKYYFIQEIIWNYWAGVACKNRLSPRNEKVLWYTKDKDYYTFNLDPIRDPDVKYPNSKKNWKLRTHPLGKNPSDVWYIPKVTSWKNRSSKERAPHPAQFPVALIDKLVKWFTNENDLVLDLFMWSGTTGEVCLRNNRPFVWFEILDKYMDYAVDRLKSICN